MRRAPPILAVILLLAALAGGARAAAPVLVTEWSGAISPAASAHFAHALEVARQRDAALLVLQLDTPGGLDTAMREMIRAMLASPVPVAIYVAPSGARAASAGTYLIYAAHVAAMAPGTNLGAATPIPMGIGGAPGAPRPSEPESTPRDKDSPAAPADALRAKQVNDAAAYLRSLAQMRGRDAQWGEEAVRSGASLSAEEALEHKVIDLIAPDLDSLLAALHGRSVGAGEQARALATAHAPVERIEIATKTRILAAIANPNVALILMMIGIYGLLFEFYTPGFGVGGVIGAIALLLGFYALQLLPINYVGLALIALGVALMTAEAFMPSFGILGAGGIAAFVAGAFMLFDEVPGMAVSWWVVAPLALLSAGTLIFVVGAALKARARPVAAGAEELAGAEARALEDFAAEGWVWCHGERWRARTRVPLERDQHARVTGRDGLVLIVEPSSSGEKG